jgi:AcrR family transcriptional regulator
MTPTPKNDQRSERTRRAIREAFVDLLHQKAYDDIGVSDISALALVNRATFYRHYPSKTDLADELLQHFREHYIDPLQHRYPGNVRRFLQENVDSIYRDRRWILGLLQIDNRRHHLERDLRALAREAYLRSAPAVADADRALQADLFAAVLLTNLRHYLTHDRRFTYDQAIGELQHVTRYLLG